MSDRAGTTRDAVEKFIDMKGIPLRLTDTAGVRETDDQLEQCGIEKTLQAAATSDINIVMFESLDGITTAAAAAASSSMITQNLDKCFFILNKCDKLALPLPPVTCEDVFLSCLKERLVNAKSLSVDQIAVISCHSGQGIPTFQDRLVQMINSRTMMEPSSGVDSGGLMVTSVRHASLLKECMDCLQLFQDYQRNHQLDLAVEHLRGASRALGQITGFIESDRVLDKVFSTFCIGK